ncbi:MAG: molecular chaperone DnaJ [Planctomycetes bacterium]|nr:molecular chaperone DnaJ [Planctomycetota bacterium]
MTQRDYYEILGVSRDAGDSEVKSAYRKLALKFHPDRNKEEGSADRFKESAEAYAVLSDPKKRQMYDQYGHAGVQGGPGHPGAPGGMNIEDIFSQFGDIFGGRGGGIFENLFGGFGGGGGQGGRVARGRSLRAAVTIELKDVLEGVERTIVLKRREVCGTCTGTGCKAGTQPQTCPQCHGRGQVHQQQGFFAVATACPMCQGQGEAITDPCNPCKGTGLEAVRREITVKIPAGIDEGAQIRLAGEGDHAPRGGQPGDLFVAIEIRPEDGFHRDASDLYIEVPIRYPQAALGDKILVPTLEGQARMTIPAGTPTGKLFRLRGHGLPRLHGGKRGDQLVRVYIDVPRKITREEKNLLKELQKLHEDKVQK